MSPSDLNSTATKLELFLTGFGILVQLPLTLSDNILMSNVVSLDSFTRDMSSKATNNHFCHQKMSPAGKVERTREREREV
jgi:hypothetical protein